MLPGLIGTGFFGSAAAAGYGSHRYWRIFVTQNSGHATYTAINEIEFHSTVGGADLTNFLAPNAISGGSGTDDVGGPAVNAFDNETGTSGDGQTAWIRSSPTNTWIGYDFGSATTVAEFTIKGASSSGGDFTRAPKNFTLDWSDDGSSWTTADTFTAYGWLSGQNRTYPETAPASGYHRFWRLLCVTTGGGTQTQIVELEFRATSGGADQTAAQTSNNGSSTGRVVYSGEGVGNEAYRAYDGTLTTTTGWFQSSGSNTYNGYIFPNPVAVQEVTVLGSATTTRSPTSLKIQSSNDGTTWTDERSASGLTWSAGETKTFSVP